MKTYTKPYLLRFAQKCVSPGRIQPSKEYGYDPNSDMMLWVQHPDKPAAIDQSGNNGPTTKKCDIEKGDDLKDRRMWQ